MGLFTPPDSVFSLNLVPTFGAIDLDYEALHAENN